MDKQDKPQIKIVDVSEQRKAKPRRDPKKNGPGVKYIPILLVVLFAAQAAAGSGWRVEAVMLNGVPTLTAQELNQGLSFDLTLSPDGHEAVFLPQGGVPLTLILDSATGYLEDKKEPGRHELMWELNSSQEATDLSANSHSSKGVMGGEVAARWNMDLFSAEFEGMAFEDVVTKEETSLEAGSVLLVVSQGPEKKGDLVDWRLAVEGPAWSDYEVGDGKISYFAGENATTLSYARVADHVNHPSEGENRFDLNWRLASVDDLHLVVSFTVVETRGEDAWRGEASAYVAAAAVAGVSVLLFKWRALRLWGEKWK